MNIKTSNFNIAYDSYYQSLQIASKEGHAILEIGGGAHPSIKHRSKFDYTIIDPDEKELAKAPEDVVKKKGTLQSLERDRKYDLIVSKMVLEHVEDPESFHKAVLHLLKPGGIAIHFYACRHSLPALINRLLPESFGDSILRLIGNRNLDDSPKYEAFYKRTKGHTEDQIEYFEKIGYIIEEYYSFVGHKYLKYIPILGFLEKIYTKTLVYLKLKSLATVALIVLSKNEL